MKTKVLNMKKEFVPAGMSLVYISVQRLQLKSKGAEETSQGGCGGRARSSPDRPIVGAATLSVQFTSPDVVAVHCEVTNCPTLSMYFAFFCTWKPLAIFLSSW